MTLGLWPPNIDQATREVLQRFGFDPVLQLAMAGRVRERAITPIDGRVPGPVSFVASRETVALPEAGTEADAEARRLGTDALVAGAVAVVVLNGGMATRFGGVVKGLAEAVDGRHFLELKLAQVSSVGRRFGGALPTAMMTSWATHDRTSAFLETLSEAPPLTFHQYVALRLQPDGALYRTAQGQVSPYSTGHGDLLVAFRGSGVLDLLHRRGVRHVFVSNVDNLAAFITPEVVGMHLSSGADVTLEVCAGAPDRGGIMTRTEKGLRVLDAGELPVGVLPPAEALINVNTMMLSMATLRRHLAPRLEWRFVQKEHEGRPVLQFERSVYDVCRLARTTLLRVPASGPESRFVPVKTPADHRSAQPWLRRMADRLEA